MPRGLSFILASLAAMGALSCSIPTLESYDADRATALSKIAGLSPSQRVEALRNRLLRDGLATQWLGKVVLTPLDVCSSNPSDKSCLYLAAPLREHVAEDYILLAEASSRAGDADGAIAAFEDAIDMADGWVLSKRAASRIREAAMRGEAAFWTAHDQPARAAAALVLANAEHAWPSTPDAAEADRAYDQLMTVSAAAMQKNADAQALQAALAAVGQVSTMAQSRMQTGRRGNGGGTNLQLGKVVALAEELKPMVVQTVQRLAPQLAKALDEAWPRGADQGPLRGIFGALPDLGDAMKRGSLDGFVHSPQGTQAMQGLVASLSALRRGEPMGVAVGLAQQMVPQTNQPSKEGP